MNKKINSYGKASYESPLLEALNVGNGFETVLCDSDGISTTTFTDLSDFGGAEGDWE